MLKRSMLLVAGLALPAAPLTAAPLTVSGIVHGPHGRLISGARVRLLPVVPGFETSVLFLSGRTAPDPIATTSTNTAGRYTLAAPAPGVVKVVVEAAGFVPMQHAPLPLVAPMELPPVDLAEAAPALVEVVDRNGAPVPGAWVSARPAAGSFWEGRAENGWRVGSRWGSTDFRGRVSLPRAAAERVDLAAFVPASLAAAGARRVEGARLVLPDASPSTLGIEVREPDGRPAVEVLVAVGEAAWPVGRTAGDGKLVLDRHPTEKVKVRLFSPDGRQRTEWLETGVERAVFQMGKLTRVAGRVVDAGTHRPIPGALVWTGHDPGAFARADAEGRYDLVAPMAERWWVQVEAAGYRSARAWPAMAEVDASRAPSFDLVPTMVGRGRIVDNAGRPVEAVGVTATALPTSSARTAFQLDEADGRSVSDPDGRFVLSGLQPGVAYLVEARRKGFAPRRLAAQRLPDAGPAALRGGPVALGTIVLFPAVRIEGRVMDVAGRPIEGVGVWRLAKSPAGRSTQPPRTAPATTTGTDGRFVVADLAHGEQVHLSIHHADYLPAAIPALVAPRRQPLDIVLRPAARLTGWVMDDDGQPVTGASVTLRPEEPPVGVAEPASTGKREIQATVEADGRFQLDSVAPGRYEISALAEGFQSPPVLRLVVVPETLPEEVRFVLERGAVVTGRVLTAGGGPVRGARVLVGQAAASADESGIYRLEGVAVGRHTIEARHRAYGRALQMVSIAPGENVLDLRFPAGQRLAGRVLDDAGKPAPGAMVALRAAAQGDHRELQLVTGAAGRFAFPQVTAGLYQLAAEKDGLVSPEPLQVEVDNAPLEGLELTLSRGATLAGRILGLSADELADVQVFAEREEGGQSTGRADVTGRYEVPGLAPGIWRVRASLHSGAREAAGVVEVSPGMRQVALELELRRGLALAGQVLHAGAPLAGASVTVTAHDQPSARQVSTSYEGRFRLLDLKPGWYRVEVAHPGELLTDAQDLHLARDEELTIDIATAQVSGRVVSSFGSEPVADALVAMQRLVGAGDGGLLTVGTDSRGGFRLARVTEGRYRLTVQKSGYAPLVQELEVQAGIELAPLELAPVPNTGAPQ